MPRAGTYTLTIDTSNPPVVRGGPQFQPLAANAPLLIDQGGSQEVATPTSVECSWTLAGCSIVVSLSKAHTAPFQIRSGTTGLQEALNDAPAVGGVVVLDPSWTGSTAEILAAVGRSGVQIEDQRAGAASWYNWNGAGYVQTLGLQSDGTAHFGKVTSTGPALSPTTIEGITYADQFPGATDAAKIDDAVNSLGASKGIVVAPPSLAVGALPASVPSSMVYEGLNGDSLASPSGITITSGAPPGNNADNILLNLRLVSTSPSGVPQNTLYVQHTASGSLAGNSQNANWAIFAAGQVASPTSSQPFMEEDAEEAEASATGSGSFPKLVGLGAQNWVDNHAGSTVAVEHSDSIYARAPYLAGSGGSASIADAVSLQVDTPAIGTANNAGIALESVDTAHPATMQIDTAGNPVWEIFTNTFATETDDLFLAPAGVPVGGGGASIALGHGGPSGGTGTSGPLYLNSGGTAAVVINGEPTPPNLSRLVEGSGGLAVFAGGGSDALQPVAASGIIRIPANEAIAARTPSNSADTPLIGTNAQGNVVLDANARGAVFGGTLAIAPHPLGSAPSCSSVNEGQMAAITDSTVVAWGATIAGGGSNHVLGYCDGSNWTVVAK